MELQSIGHPGLWIGFLAFVLAMLALDLGVFHRKAHVVSLREAAIWSAVWVALAGIFNLWVWNAHGSVKGMEFLTGYVIEKSLSVDNIFVFAVIFSAFAVPPAYQHRVLFWGILGALIMRALFILVGGAMLERFHWMIWVFGAFLVLTGIKLMMRDDSKVDPAKNPIVRMVRRFIPMTDQLRRRQVLRASERSGQGHAVVPRADRRRGDGRDLRGRLDPGDLRDHA
jgi:tellurite resistance protein TerC